MAANMTKPTNFNDLKGDNITEIVKYLHPHTEENKRLKEELKVYDEMFKTIKTLIGLEFGFQVKGKNWRRRSIKRCVEAASVEALNKLGEIMPKCRAEKKHQLEISIRCAEAQQKTYKKVQQRGLQNWKLATNRIKVLKKRLELHG